jgi:hypothetical protein
MRIVAVVTLVAIFCVVTVQSSLCYLRFNVLAVALCDVVEQCPQPDPPSCFDCGYVFPPAEISGCCPVDSEFEPRQPVVIICGVCISSEPAYTDRCDINRTTPRLWSTLLERRLTSPDESNESECSTPPLRETPTTEIPSYNGRPQGIHPTIATTVLRT